TQIRRLQLRTDIARRGGPLSSLSCSCGRRALPWDQVARPGLIPRRLAPGPWTCYHQSVANRTAQPSPEAPMSSHPDSLQTVPEGTGQPTHEADQAPTCDAPAHVGRYRVERLLGAGGFGRVYLAHDAKLQRLVAIKVPHSHLVATPEDAE